MWRTSWAPRWASVRSWRSGRRPGRAMGGSPGAGGGPPRWSGVGGRTPRPRPPPRGGGGGGGGGGRGSAEGGGGVLMVDGFEGLEEGFLIARRSRNIALESVLAGMGLSIGAMSLAVAGFFPFPVIGAMVQEVIDVA